ncbi:unnamed protein product [Rhizophagus irregularis]|nr:unnamed protein product [Rhizophagus irregularis]
MKATDNVAPKSFWTDAEPGLINAVSHIFPNTPHFYCLFHIWQNIIKHLKTKLGSKFHSFSTYFYSCRNTLSTELFEKKWKSMLDTFPECYSYMMRALYPNRSSWAKSYLPFQFNAGIQSTQSVESFNALIKKSLNSASTLCDIEKAINRRHEDEFQYCKLVDLKAQQTTVGLPHLSSQFFSKIDAVLTQFLTPLILSWERFQISQSFTYEGCLTQSVIDDEILGSDTINDNFIEDIVDEPQVTLKSLLTDTQCSIIEMWRIRRIGGISRKENIVVLFTDGTHLCTCLETITKGIICRHFWRVMLYSSLAQFHIRIIPVRWYNNSVLTNLDINLENSPILTAVESSNTTLLPQVNFTLQSLQQFQRSDHNEIIINKNLPQRNRFGIAFSTAKTAVNIAIETNSDVELIRLLKEFIATKRGGDGDGDRNGDGDGDRNGNGDDNGNGNSNDNEIEINKDINDIVPLQEHLINNITNPNVTRIRGAPSKKRIKSAIESSKKRVAMQEISLNKDSNQLAPAKQRRRCLTCGKLGHYQKRCPSNIN